MEIEICRMEANMGSFSRKRGSVFRRKQNFHIRTWGSFRLFSVYIAISRPTYINFWPNSILPPRNLIFPLLLWSSLPSHFLPEQYTLYCCHNWKLMHRICVYHIIYPWYIITFVVILATEFVGFIMFFIMVQEDFESWQFFALHLCSQSVFISDSVSISGIFVLISASTK